MITNENSRLLGQVLDDRYEILEFIAQGGMGRVFKGRQLTLDRFVAVKLLLDVAQADESFRKRFFLEASLCSRLSQPNIIRIFDYGHDDSAGYYIVMEYLQGKNLGQILSETGPLPPLRVISMIKQVCAGLIEAHGQHLVHRDLKPSNLFVSPDELVGDFVKILDFGVIKQTDQEANITQVDSTLGSPQFMSPEQIEGGAVDARSDLYSLGVVLFAALAGSPPFRGGAPLQVIYKHLYESPPPISKFNPDGQVPPALEAIAQKALCKNPDQRFQSAREMLKALQECEQKLRGEDEWKPQPSTPIANPPTPATDLTRPLPDPLDEDITEVFSLADLEHMNTLDLPQQRAAPTPPAPTQVERLHKMDLSGFTAFVDLNCPFCYALHERVSSWGLLDQIEWCLVEHASHVLEGPFALDQEQLLSTEVFEVHHRAPEIELSLPSQRCNSRFANRLLVEVQDQHPNRIGEFRAAVYQSLWRKGEDIGDLEVLAELLDAHGLSRDLLSSCTEDSYQIQAWQSDWENADFDSGIPVLSHPSTGKVLIGLPDPEILIEFLLGERSRVVDNSVCYYQKQPSILVCGWMSHVWPLLVDIRECCEILQAPTLAQAEEILRMAAVPDLLIVEQEYLDLAEMEQLAILAHARSVHWLVAARSPKREMEIEALSMGAKEYLTVTGDAKVAKVRLRRIIQDRYSLARVASESLSDPLTKVSSRRHLLERLEDEWELASRTGALISMILIQLNDWKAFNRAQNYMVGDQVLVQVANVLRGVVHRPGDLLARFGSHEFTVLLPATPTQTAQGMARQIRAAVLEAKIENQADVGGPYLSASVGVATLASNDDTSIHHLYDKASQSLAEDRVPGR